MTYPPQQAGPGGWEPERAEQQQPNWYGNKHTSWDQRPGSLEPPPGRPLQPGQQGPPPQPAEPGHQLPPPPDWTGASFVQQPLPREPFGFEDVAPPRRRVWRRWVLGGLGLVVAGAAGIVVYLLFLTGPGSARPVAQTLVDKVNAGNLDALSPDLCSARRTTLTAQLDQLDKAAFDIRLGKVVTDGDSATARLQGTYSIGGASDPVDQTIGLVVENGQWKVCDLDA